MDEKYAKYLLDKTQQDYNRIAGHFSKTRAYIWEDLKYLTQFVWAGEKILDLGCGNGRLLGLFKNKDIDYIGVDNSEKLIAIAKKSQKSKVKSQNHNSKVKSIEFIKAGALNLPFKSNSFDKIFSIAVFHHIPSKKFRLRFLKEAQRVLKPSGLLVLTVWNLWRPNCLNFQFKHMVLKLTGRSRLDFKDIFYPWKNPEGEILAQRYIHCFTKRELKRLVRKAGFEIKEIGFLGREKRNIYIIVAPVV